MIDDLATGPVPGTGWHRAMAAGLRFRRVTDGDLPFLAEVYAATRTGELAVVPWSDADKAAFLDMQFRAQQSHYQAHYPDADRLVVVCGTQDAGRLYLARRSGQHRIIDIALLPRHRNAGLGTAILRDLMDEAAAAGRDVSIHVETGNPAMRLYRRLGFETVEDRDVHALMRWTRGQEKTTS